MEMPIVTLTTDWGNGGFFAGMVKGALYGMIEGVRVVDITHSVEPYNVQSATFVVKHACVGFPPGTIHIIDVKSSHSAEHPFVVVKALGQYFICCDNGLPAAALGDKIEEVCAIPVQENGVYNFAASNLFTRVAAMLAAGAKLSDIGPSHPTLLQSSNVGYVSQNGQYRIYILYIDSYGNAYLGMSYSEFESLRQGRPFSLTVREQEINELSASYYQQHASNDPRRRLRLTVSATGLLELAVKEGSFEQLMGLHVYDSVLLRFKD